jgi:hypothetical protein
VPGSTWLEMSRASRLTDLGVRVFQADQLSGCLVGYLSGQ